MTETFRRSVWEGPAALLVGVVRRAHHYRVVVSLLGLFTILGGACGHLLFNTLDIDPLSQPYRVRVELDRSGGLLPGQEVTLRGVRVGRIDSVAVAGEVVVVIAAIDENVRIPTSGQVRAAALSAAGEQYLDFVPAGNDGPYLTDGALITADRTSTPVPMSDMLESLSGTLSQIDPARLAAISRELGVGQAGPDKLAAIIDGGTFLISTLDTTLPHTVNLLRNSRVVLATLHDGQNALRSTSTNLSATLGGVSSMTAGFEQLVAQTPPLLTALDTILAENSPTMVQLLGNLVTVSQVAYSRIPALNEFFFPQQRAGSALDAVTSAFHDGGVWALASIYPRYACDYNVPRRAGSIPDYADPYLHADCTDPDPTLMPRGARNAPRPVDDPVPPPPVDDPFQTADPSPTGPLTIPTPYGGPYAPVPR
ncbi:MlaD family protein [Nocardia rhizosphaerihabitans]|uniref:Mce family protein n=1 Tax=Nocardia rhizosphaerihabitans TaxID=1691570 RepID=A0ABQ2L226_9NOCA|nr:MlaD family protein [Nocardia rhizosphaerihabitans]GGN99702.1 putative Mce family protein [Nocardia rhizosphaerihabitans]